MHSAYYDSSAVDREVAAGRHRDAVGGLWEQLGELQLGFLRARGLQPEHRLLDIGCGSLRLGCRAVDFLAPGHYFGLDLSEALIRAGYERELTSEQRERLPWTNLQANEEFDLSFVDGELDVAIAQSVFTHLPLNHIRRCLGSVAARLRPGGTFYATAWLVPDEWPLERGFDQPGALDGRPIVTHDVRDPYHYRLADFEYAIRGLPLGLQFIGDWEHPRGQPMFGFVRL